MRQKSLSSSTTIVPPMGEMTSPSVIDPSTHRSLRILRENGCGWARGVPRIGIKFPAWTIAGAASIEPSPNKNWRRISMTETLHEWTI